MSSLINEAKALGIALDRDEFVAAEKLTDFAQRARDNANNIGPDAQKAVLAAFNELIDAIRRHQNRTKKKIKKLQTSRRSLRKFDHIRQHTRGQRLYNSY